MSASFPQDVDDQAHTADLDQTDHDRSTSSADWPLVHQLPPFADLIRLLCCFFFVFKSVLRTLSSSHNQQTKAPNCWSRTGVFPRVVNKATCCLLTDKQLITVKVECESPLSDRIAWKCATCRKSEKKRKWFHKNDHNEQNFEPKFFQLNVWLDEFDQAMWKAKCPFPDYSDEGSHV